MKIPVKQKMAVANFVFPRDISLLTTKSHLATLTQKIKFIVCNVIERKSNMAITNKALKKKSDPYRIPKN